jgi:hypothetical protein
VTGLLATTTQQFGPPKPPAARKIAEATGLLMVLVVAAVALLFVGWIAMRVVRRRWIGIPGMERQTARTRPSKDPWFEAGRRAETEPRGHAGEEPPAGEPYQ